MKTRNLPILLRRPLAVIVCAAFVWLEAGCAVVAVGAASAGAVAYVRGELSANLGSKLDSVVVASSRALDDLRFAKISERRDAFSAVIIARTAQDKKVTVTLTKSTDALTAVTIRVGVFGNQAMSLAILDKIKANL